MSSFIDYLPYVAMALSALIGIINMVYTRSTGKSIDKELTIMSKTFAPDRRTTKYRQTFSPLIKTYRLDKTTNELVENPDPIDVDKLVESMRDSCLDRLLERFMPVDVTDKVKSDLHDTELDLSDIGNAMDIVHDWRDRLNLDEDTPFDSVLDKITQYRDEQLKAYQASEQLKNAQHDAEERVKKIADLKKQLEDLQGGDKNET